MARTLRFHLDECCNLAIAAGLRRRGIDVTTSRDAELLRAPDERQAAFGRAERRVVVTHDADFRRLQTAGIPHAGIAFCTKKTRLASVKSSSVSSSFGRFTSPRS